MTIFTHELRRGAKSTLIWGISVGALILFCMALYPQMAGQAENMTDIFSQLGGFSAAFGLDTLNFGTAMGFYGVECGACLTLGGGMFAAFAGSGAISKEELGHTAEFLYTHPISRARVLGGKFAALLGQIMLFNLLCVGFALAGFAMAGEGPDLEPFLWFHLSQLLMQFEVGALCFALSAFAKRAALGCGLGIMAGLYFLAMWGNLSDKVEWVRFLTPFWYADSARVIAASAVEWPLVALGMGYGGAALALAIYGYGKKDITA